jgi:hypothetical protein
VTPSKKAPRKSEPKVYSRERVESEARKLYARNGLAGLSADARALDLRAGRPTLAILAKVYWNEEGAKDPAKGKSAKARANDLARRRKSGVRFEILAGSLAAALGRPVSVTEIRRVLESAGVDPDRSYTGRGTRKSRAGEATRTEEKSA